MFTEQYQQLLRQQQLQRQQQDEQRRQQLAQQQYSASQKTFADARRAYLRALVNFDLLMGNTLKTWDIKIRIEDPL